MKRAIQFISAVMFIAVCSVCLTPAVGSAKTYRLATHYNTQHPGYAALQRIVKEVEAKTNGEVKIKIYPSSQLGDYTVTYEDLMKGAVDMALIPIPSEFNPKLEMNFIPYLAKDYKDLPKVFGPQSYFFKNYGAVHAKQNVKLLGMYVEGLIGIVFTKMPPKYEDPKAAKGLRVRAPAIEVYNLVLEDMGFNATTIPYADLYSALQTGVVDGAIGLTPQLAYSDFRDIIKYYITYNIFAENIGFLMSQKSFDALSPANKKVVEDAFMKEALNSYTVAGQLDAEAMEGLRKYGVEIIRLNDKQLAAYASQVKAETWPKLTKNIGKDTMTQLVNSVK